MTTRQPRTPGRPSAPPPELASSQAAELYLRGRYDSWQAVWWIKGELVRCRVAVRRRVKPGLRGEWTKGAPKAAKLARQLDQVLRRLLPDGEPFPGLAAQLGALAELLEQHVEVGRPTSAELAEARDGYRLRFARCLEKCHAKVADGRTPTALELAAWAVVAGVDGRSTDELEQEEAIGDWKQARRRLNRKGTSRR